MSEEEETDVILRIRGFMWQVDDRGPRWYVGVAHDLEDALFREHRLRRKGDDWISLPVSNGQLAYRIVKYLTRGLGAEGEADSSGTRPFHVYAYRKRAHTRP